MTFVRNTNNSSGYSLIEASHDQVLSLLGSSSDERSSETLAFALSPERADRMPSAKSSFASAVWSTTAGCFGWTDSRGAGGGRMLSNSNLIWLAEFVQKAEGEVTTRRPAKTRPAHCDPEPDASTMPFDQHRTTSRNSS